MSRRQSLPTLRSTFLIATFTLALAACGDDDDPRRDAAADARRDALGDGVSVLDSGVADALPVRDVALGDGATADLPGRDTHGLDAGALDAGLDSARRDGGADVPIGADGATGPGLDAPSGFDGMGIDGASAPDAGGIVANRPELRPATEARIGQLWVPAGFRIRVFARDLANPRMLAVGPDGSVYVTSPLTSQVLRLVDRDGDGLALGATERSTVVSSDQAADLQGVHGITLHNGRAYLASVRAVYAATLSDGRFEGLTRLVGDLPDGGQHANRTLAVGPDGKLYVTVGSTCNACNESNSEHATMLRFELDGTPAANPAQPAHPLLARNPLVTLSPRIFASGLRNTLGFDWHPQTGQLIGADHGSDGLGNDIPNDELNVITGGWSYGWPYCWGARAIDPAMDDPSPSLTKEAYCPTTEPMTIGLQAHSAPIGFLFYRGAQFPSAYRGDAFVTFRGSWNRDVPTGFKVVRVRFQNGYAIEDFVTGFLIENGAAQFGRLAGLAVDNEGALLIAEDSNGVIYRVSYEGTALDGGVPSDAGTGG
jgi:glucose/arabinose dehydrogenase